MTSNASPSRSFSVLKRWLGDSGSSLNRRPSAHSPSLATRCSTIFNSSSDRPGSLFCLAVSPIGRDGWLSTGANTLSSTAAAKREAAAPALAYHPDALPRRLLVEVAGQRAEVMGDRPVGVRRKRGEFLCHTTAQHDRHRTRSGAWCARCAVQRRAGDGESVVHQMITQGQHTGMYARHLRNQHHTGSLALAIDIVGEAGSGEWRGGPSGQIGFRSRLAGDIGVRRGHGVSYFAGSGGCFCTAAASVRYSSVPAAPVIAICAGPVGPFSRVVHTGSASSPPS